METCCTCNVYVLHGHTLKSAMSDYDQRHVIVFQPISLAARGWSYDRCRCCEHFVVDVKVVCLQDTISVHRPGFYAQRFQSFIGETVFHKLPPPRMISTVLCVTTTTHLMAGQPT